MPLNVVIVADGSFPEHPVPLGYLNHADVIVCCDGSAQALVDRDMLPDAIIGDMDSISNELLDKFADRIFKDEEQETNDLTKAVKWCVKSGYNDLVIVGATGKREDHTIGNISLLAEYSEFVNVKMVTDTGTFIPLQKNSEIKTTPGQQISVFSINPETQISSKGLKYSLAGRKLKNWWEATLNEAIGDSILLEFTGGPLIVFLEFTDNKNQDKR